MRRQAFVGLLREAAGAAEVRGEGGYADVKLLCYADLGVHQARWPTKAQKGPPSKARASHERLRSDHGMTSTSAVQ